MSDRKEIGLVNRNNRSICKPWEKRIIRLSVAIEDHGTEKGRKNGGKFGGNF